jgi:hypothetical protein
MCATRLNSKAGSPHVTSSKCRTKTSANFRTSRLVIRSRKTNARSSLTTKMIVSARVRITPVAARARARARIALSCLGLRSGTRARSLISARARTSAHGLRSGAVSRRLATGETYAIARTRVRARTARAKTSSRTSVALVTVMERLVTGTMGVIVTEGMD